MRLVGMLLLLLATQEALACVMTPSEQETPPDELIARTGNIFLARAVRADAASDRWHVLYTFKVERTLKGKPQAAFQILGEPLFGEMSVHRFNEHTDAAFWDDQGGREYHDTSCKIRPEFAVGNTYLIFLDKPYHNKSFEQILFTGEDGRQKDQWLRYVEERVSSPKR